MNGQLARDIAEVRVSWPLSFEQEGQWFLEQMYPGNSALNRPCVVRLKGELNVKALEQSINEIMNRHEMLRAYFPVEAGVPCQVIRPMKYMELPLSDLSPLPELERNVETERKISDHMRHSFDLCCDSMFRTELLRLSAQEHVLIHVFHHIVFDGWSRQNYLKELSRLYRFFNTGKALPLSELPLPYTRFAFEQRERFTHEESSHDLQYWRLQLSGELPELNLMYDTPRPSRPTVLGKIHHFWISADRYQGMKRLCGREKVTPFMLLLTVLKVLLHRYTGQEDLMIGSMVSGRNHPDLEPMIGMLVNTLVIRTQMREGMSFREALHQVRGVSLKALQHQNIPFAKLVAEFAPTRSTGANPFFQVMLNMHNMPQMNEEVTGLQIEEMDVEHEAALVDLTLKVTEHHGELTCSLIYNQDIWGEESIARMAGHFQTLLDGCVAHPETSISLLPILTEREHQQLLYDWNAGTPDYPLNSIHELFAEQVRLHPNKPALIYHNIPMTYAELDRRANQTANYLRQSGLQSEDLAAVCLERSPDMIVSFLAVLKAGGAYVPIDIDYPAERISLMLHDAKVSFVITTQNRSALLPSYAAQVIYLDEEAEKIASCSGASPVNISGPNNLANVMYTSGSTGKPKGVAVAHQGIVRLVKNVTYASLGPEETFLFLTSAAFDVSAFEIYGSLLNGGALAIMESHKPSLVQIGETIRLNRVTSLCVTPEMLNLLLEDCSAALGSLRQIFSAGDALPVWIARKCLTRLPACQLINAYGPTENSVYSTSYRVKEILHETSIPIGRPIANDSVYILDPYLHPVPVGVFGELYLAGDGLARGYLHNDHLTQEKFPSHPFAVVPGGKLYRTGDLARYRSDGNIEFLGRMDNQVKIRGCRIEIGEIETVVSQFPGVSQTAAGTWKSADGANQLVVYVVMQRGIPFDQQKLREFVRSRLPEYMMPSFFVELSHIPLSPVGKLDRKKLPAPNLSTHTDQQCFPRNKVEEQLVRIWEKLLHVRPIGIMDNFFDLGGHSLLAMRLFAEIEREFGKKLPVSSIFQKDTVEKLAELLSSDRMENETSSSLVAIKANGSQPPLFCIHELSGEVICYGNLAQALGDNRPVFGLRFIKGEDDSPLTIPELAAKYVEEIKKIQPRGPYYILGHSLGGIIAYEMAQQLYQTEQEVSLLTILDTRNPHRYSFIFPQTNRWTGIFNVWIQLPWSKKLPYTVHKISNQFRRNAAKRKDKALTKRFNQAISLYHPKPYSGRTLLLRADGNFHNLVTDDHNGWDLIGPGAIHVHRVPGKHITILDEKNVKHVAKYVKQYVETEEQ